jgi:hypothetical protein
MMDETTRVAVAVIGVCAILAGLGLVLFLHMRAHARLWRAYAADRGGSARMSMSLNAFARYRRTGPLGEIQVEEWRGGRAGEYYSSQWIATLRLRPGSSSPAFLLGDDAWASAFARWARRLPPCDGLGPDAPVPLDRGRCELSTLRWWRPRARELAHELRLFLAYGRGQLLRVHVPGGLSGPADFPRLDRTIELLEQVAGSAPAGRTS